MRSIPAAATCSARKYTPALRTCRNPLDLAIIAVRAEYTSGYPQRLYRGGSRRGNDHFRGVCRSRTPGFATDSLVDLARQHGFPFIGPNCLGIYVPGHIDTFFIPSERMVRPEPGKVALVSQSGGVLVDQMTKFAEQGVGFSLGVSIGNKALVRELDLLEYLAADPGTGVIAFYIEGFARGEGRDFVQAARQCAKTRDRFESR